MVQWLRASDLPARPIKLALCGQTGSGKTHICTTFPNPIFVLPSKENSEAVFRGAPFPLTHVWDRASMLAALQELLVMDRNGQLQGCTVCVESLSHHSDDVENELTKGGKLDMFPKWGEHRAHFLEIRSILDAIQTAHIVCTMLSQRRVLRDKGGQVTGVEHTFGISGKSGPHFVSTFDAIGYCEQVANTKPPIFQTHFCAHDYFPARTRLRGMPPASIPNFNFADHVLPYLG